MSKNYADWNITLYTTCPECAEYFDLIEQDVDFWDGRDRDFICESDTTRTSDVSVTCPECNHEFKVDFQY